LENEPGESEGLGEQGFDQSAKRNLRIAQESHVLPFILLSAEIQKRRAFLPGLAKSWAASAVGGSGELGTSFRPQWRTADYCCVLDIEPFLHLFFFSPSPESSPGPLQVSRKGKGPKIPSLGVFDRFIAGLQGASNPSDVPSSYCACSEAHRISFADPR
jgi:hypothetical protein